MLKKNLFKKKAYKSLLSISKIIESFFNFLKENFFDRKKGSKNFKTFDKKIFLTIVAIFFTTAIYLLIPAFYDKNQVKEQLENQISDQYNLEVRFEQPIKYGLLPKPHFYSKNVIISQGTNSIAESKKFRVFISIKNLFSLNNIVIGNLIFNKTDFKINKSNFNFFINLLNKNKSNQDINFLNTKVFYLDQSDDIIFLTNIKNLNYFYQDDILQRLESKLDIFNIPINLDIDHDVTKKRIFSELKSYPLRLNLKNNIFYNKKLINGLLDLSIINQSKSINYTLENNSLEFKSNDDQIKGKIFIKPFFLSSSIDLFEIDIKKIFHDNSILINILKSEILNSKNLNGEIFFNANGLKGINFLKDIKFTILFEEGEIFIQNLKVIFKNSVILNLSNTQLIIDNNKIDFAGYISFDFTDIDNFYAHYQVGKKYRKDLKKINLGFLFNFNERLLEIDNLRIDGESSKTLNEFEKKFNSEKDNILNKIVFRNLIKDFFRNL